MVVIEARLSVPLLNTNPPDPIPILDDPVDLPRSVQLFYTYVYHLRRSLAA